MHRLNIATLDKKWQEYDELLLHAAFQVLVDFMEKDYPDIVDWNAQPDTKAAWKEISSLYKWWKKIRPRRKREEPKYPKGVHFPPFVPTGDGKGYTLDMSPEHNRWRAYSKKITAFEDKCETEDQANLLRLVAIRNFLWC
jgi:hypothetical protein